ncbi:hypothetical protein BJF90_34115 [Pseudonocardia sp. CNS-004]|nr:hypothetical protein BJF90_34115 [Pseudonocardia sp. CNS-004]
MAVRAHRREQRGDVVIEVGGGGRLRQGAADPVGEGDAARHHPPAGPAHGEQRGVEHPAAHAAVGSSPRTSAADGGAVRAGSAPCQHAHRDDFQPVRLPWSVGELAKAASSTGPSACSTAQRAPRSAASPVSRLTCTAAVEHIALRPEGPRRSNDSSMLW